MAGNESSHRWIIVGLIALGVALAATLPMLGSNEAGEGESDSAEAVEGEDESTYDPDGGSATRRIKENCDPVAEAKKYEEFIDRRALAILSWNNMPERAAKLKIPVYITGVEDGAIALGILDIPLREQYVAIWLGSGHIRPGPGGSFLLEPCSARIEAWEDMERAVERDPEDGEE